MDAFKLFVQQLFKNFDKQPDGFLCCCCLTSLCRRSTSWTAPRPHFATLGSQPFPWKSSLSFSLTLLPIGRCVGQGAVQEEVLRWACRGQV